MNRVLSLALLLSLFAVSVRKTTAAPYWIDSAAQTAPSAETADLILTGGKIVTVDKDFSTASALAVAGERILAVGSDEEIEKLAGTDTKRIDLAGKTIIPGLIDSHLHAPSAAIYEFDHQVPSMEIHRGCFAVREGKGQDPRRRRVDRYSTGFHHPAPRTPLSDAG